MADTIPLRRRNQLAAMRMVQATAVTMFEATGFEATTMKDVAGESGVSASTIYRYFGTKEALVLWDERDDVVESELATRLAEQSPVDAFCGAMAVAYGAREDMDLFLRRLRLVYGEPAIWAAAARQDRVNRSELALAFASVSGRSHAAMLDTLTAAVCLTALDVAFEEWQRDPSAAGLTDLIVDSADRLRWNEPTADRRPPV